MKKILSFLTVALLLCCLGGCQTTNGDVHDPGRVVLGDTAGTTTIVGTVTYRQLEGGFWAIRQSLDSGGTTATYEPLNLPEAFRQEGLPVRIQAKILKNRISFRQVGPIIEIRSISPR